MLPFAFYFVTIPTNPSNGVGFALDENVILVTSAPKSPVELPMACPPPALNTLLATSPTTPVEDAIPAAAAFNAVAITEVFPTSPLAYIICLKAPVTCTEPTAPPVIFDNAPPIRFPAFPITFPHDGNAQDNALSKTPPSVVEFPLPPEMAFATVPNAVYVFPITFPSASPIVESNPFSWDLDSPDGV